MVEWIKVAHIVSIIAWMAGLLYLPRLLVYHTVAEAGSDKSETFKVMERRLLSAIMTPAMISGWIFGLILAYLLDIWSEYWFIGKLIVVLVMSVFHFRLAGWVKDFATDQNQRSQRFFRIANELPTIGMIFVIILVVVKPF